MARMFWGIAGAAALAIACSGGEDENRSDGAGGSPTASGGTEGGTGGAGTGGSVGSGGSSGGMPGTGGVPPTGTGGSGGMALPGCTPERPSMLGEGELVVDMPMIGIETADDGVYFIQTSTVSRVAYGATTVEPLVTGIDASTSSSPDSEAAFRVNATHVFWEQEESIWRAPRAPGSTAEAIVQDLGNVSHISVDETHVYYADRTENRVGRIALDTLEHQVLQEDITAQDLHVVGEFLYINSFYSYRVVRMPASGGELESLTRQGDFPKGMWIEDGTIYWTNRSSIYATPIGDWQTSNRLGAGTDEVAQLRVEGDRLYFRDARGYVGWIDLDGTDCAIIGGGSDIAVHETDLYVSTSSGLRRFGR